MADGDRQSNPEFRDELVGAADHLGIPVLAVEKDYWVSRSLRGMAAARPDGFIFKGGTSITKGWRIGNRFSEDIDILDVQMNHLETNYPTPEFSRMSAYRRVGLAPYKLSPFSPKKSPLA